MTPSHNVTHILTLRITGRDAASHTGKRIDENDIDTQLLKLNSDYDASQCGLVYCFSEENDDVKKHVRQR